MILKQILDLPYEHISVYMSSKNDDKYTAHVHAYKSRTDEGLCSDGKHLTVTNSDIDVVLQEVFDRLKGA